MTLTLSPNAEKVVADYLRETVEITDRIVSKTPKSTDEPWVRYTQLNKRAWDGHRSDYFLEAYFQFECYAGKEGGQPEASELGRTVRAALVHMPFADEVEGAVITGVDIRGDSRQPDLSLDSRERFIISAAVWMHP